MSNDMSLANRLAPVAATDKAKLAAARRAVLSRVDLPIDDPRHATRAQALDFLAMLGLVNDPRAHARTGQWLPRHRPARP